MNSPPQPVALASLRPASKREPWAIALAAGILLVALVWRLLGITTTQVWPDEAVTLVFMRFSWWDQAFHVPQIEGNPPLAFIPFKVWAMLFHSEWTMRLLPVGLGVATVGVLMATARRMHPKAWIYTGLLAAFCPVPVHYSQEIRVYGLLMLASALSLWAALRVGEQPASRKRLVVFAAFTALAAHAHAVGVFVYPMCAAFIVCLSGMKGLRALFRPASTGLWLVLISPMIWFNLHWAHQHQQSWWIAPVTWDYIRLCLEECFGLSIIERWMQSRSPHPTWTAFALERLIIFSSAGFLIAGLADRRLRPRVAVLLAAVATYCGLMLLASLVSVHIIIVRTLLPATEAALVLMGVVAAGCTRHPTRMLALGSFAILATIAGVSWGWYATVGPSRRAEMREAYQWVRDRVGPHDLVVSFPTWLEDQTAYELGDLVSGEQLLGDSVPLYSGFPARRRMTTLDVDPQWRERLRAAISATRAASGGQYSVWCIELISPVPDEMPEILSEEHVATERFTPATKKSISALRFVPLPPNTSAVPLATSRPAQPN
jgi:4-amino-4-deoxy-L-arabinose transferase-like glycosyltransferase